MLRAGRQRKSEENALLLLRSSSAALPSRPGPPPPNPAQSWPGDGAKGPGSRGGGWQDAGAARPAAARASGRRRGSCHLLARPPGAPLASSRRPRAGGLAAPAHRSPRPQLLVLTPARAPPPAPPPPPLQRRQRFGAPRDRPPLSRATPLLLPLPLPLLLLLPPPPAPPRRPGEGPAAPHGAPFPHGLRGRARHQRAAAAPAGRGPRTLGGRRWRRVLRGPPARRRRRRRPPSGSRPGEGGWQGRRCEAPPAGGREGGRAGRAAATNPDSGAPPLARPQPLGEEGVGNMIMTARALAGQAPSLAGSADILGDPSVPGAVSSGERHRRVFLYAQACAP